MIISKKKRVVLKRVVWAFIPAVLVLGLGVIIFDLYIIHKLSHPPRTDLYSSPRDFQVILQRPMWFDEKWKNSDSTQSVGWLLSRGRPGPAVILSHGYGSNRSELLTLAFEMWKAGYHVLVYDLRGHGESPVNWSGLGTYETEDLLSAIKFLRSKKTDAGEDLIDGRIGLYGVEIGGYISLAASAQNPSVKAIAVDSAYPDVTHFITYRLKTYVGSNSWATRIIDSTWTARLTGLAMQVYLLRREESPPALEAVGASSGRKFLFLTASDDKAYTEMSRELHDSTRDAKTIAEVEHTRLDRLYDKASSEYDQRIVSFFREAIPVENAKAIPATRAAK